MQLGNLVLAGIALFSLACGRIGFEPIPSTSDGSMDGAIDAAAVDAAEDADAAPMTECGDGVVDPGEDCDDGDVVSGDGCDGSCEQETGWTCELEPSLCAPTGFAPIPAGTFLMGAPVGEPGRVDTGDNTEVLHEVTLTRAFVIQTTEVTQGAYEAVMGWNPSEFGPLGPGADCGVDCPVERSSWYDGAVYMNELSMREGRPPCYVLNDVVCMDMTAVEEAVDCQNGTRRGVGTATVTLGASTPYECAGYRYPTEAEWEYAARAGDQRGTHVGELVLTGCESPNPVTDRVAWFCGNAGGTTHPVAQLEPNAWGLYDTLGNVWEHVHDLHRPIDPGAAIDPWGPAADTDPLRVAKGGAWLHSAFSARPARRSPALAPQRQVGFRVARTL